MLAGCPGQPLKTSPDAASPSTSTTSTNPAEAAAMKGQPMLTVQSEPYGTTPDGAAITSYTLQNETGMKVSLINLGATVTAVEVPDRDGKSANVTLNFPDLAGYLKNGPYFGGTCGRYANRIANAKFSLDGNEYELVKNNGEHTLHGGKVGFNKLVWKSEPFETADAAGVKFTLVSPDGDEGYPGALTTVVKYSLTTNNELTIEYSATTDKPTVLNLTNHCYWNLAGAANGTVLGQQLELACDKYLPVDEGAIPTGELAPVADTPMDFRKAHAIGDAIDKTINGGGGYDHCYVVNGQPGELRLAARVIDPSSGRGMEIVTTEPGIQLYTGNFLSGTPENGNAVKHGAFCLEAQHFPDSPNRPEFPTTTLKPGEEYRQTTIHRFFVEPAK
ncbi:MAG: galactose-1-epimerase [Planctomyces sp.]|nr:galactose-1-epimerase [Planctomyces sp.]